MLIFNELQRRHYKRSEGTRDEEQPGGGRKFNSLGFKPQAIEKQKNIQTLYMKSMLIKAFLMMVLIFQLGLDGQSQTGMGTGDVDDGVFDPTSTTGSGGGSGTGGSGTPGDPTYSGGTSGRNDVPIDGGLSLLLAAGVGYGVKRARKNINMKL